MASLGVFSSSLHTPICGILTLLTAKGQCHWWVVCHGALVRCYLGHKSITSPAQEAGKAKEYEALLGEIESAKLEGGALDAACAQLQALVHACKPAASVLQEACELPSCS